ncbi:MAG: 7-cyano-7-deazaguanine synthase QueC [Pseudomonadota bacterium]
MGEKAKSNRAVVLLSGGLDSTTVLGMAVQQGFECYALSFDYGQRHSSELLAAQKVASSYEKVVHKTIRLDLGAFGGSALTDDKIDVPDAQTNAENQIPITYVPARNTVFLSLAVAWAEVLDAQRIFIGVNAVDYSGYPDCRPEFIQAFQKAARLGTKAGVETNNDAEALRIETPLVDLSKADIIRAGMAHGVDYSLTVSCYQANAEGAACGRCDSCYLRRKGFEDAKVTDPTIYANGSGSDKKS